MFALVRVKYEAIVGWHSPSDMDLVRLFVWRMIERGAYRFEYREVGSYGNT